MTDIFNRNQFTSTLSHGHSNVPSGPLTCGLRSRCANDAACIILTPESICFAISLASVSGRSPEFAITLVSRSPRWMYSMARNISEPSLNHPKKSTNTAASRDYGESTRSRIIF